MKKILETLVDGNALSIKHQNKLWAFLNFVRRGGYKHDFQNSYHDLDSSALSLGSRHMTEMFRKKKDNGYYKKVIDTFCDCVDDSYRFGKGKSRTKAYVLKKWVRDEMHCYFTNPEPTPLIRYFDKANIHAILTEVPKNAIEELDSLGQPRSSTFSLPSLVPINSQALNQAICDFENSVHFDERRRDDYRNYNDMIDLRFSLNNNIAPNFIPQIYREASNGRLCPVNASNFPSIIPMSKEVKALIFSGMELYDYDISNCHFAIFQALCRKYGLECPNIDYYLAHKSECRKEWSKEFDVDIKLIKSYVLSWFYGANNNPVIHSDIQDALGLEALGKIKKHPLLKGIYSEIVKNRKVIVADHRMSNGLITNILGKEQPHKILGKKNRVGSELSHIQFGIESKIMSLVNQCIGDEMKLLIYDGWISKKIDVSVIEKEVKNQLGFDIKFDEELIQPPTLDDLMQFRSPKRNRWWKKFNKKPI